MKKDDGKKGKKSTGIYVLEEKLYPSLWSYIPDHAQAIVKKEPKLIHFQVSDRPILEEVPSDSDAQHVASPEVNSDSEKVSIKTSFEEKGGPSHEALAKCGSSSKGDSTCTQAGLTDFTATQAGGTDFTATQAGGTDFTATQAGGRDLTATQAGGMDLTATQAGGMDLTATQAGGMGFSRFSSLKSMGFAGVASLNTGFSSGVASLDTGFSSGVARLNTGFSSGVAGLNTGFSSGIASLSTGFSSGIASLSTGFSSGQATNSSRVGLLDGDFGNVGITLGQPLSRTGSGWSMNVENSLASSVQGGDSASSSHLLPSRSTPISTGNVQTRGRQFKAQTQGNTSAMIPPPRGPPPECVFCGSDNTRFEHYNNGKESQPRYRCLKCKKRFVKGGKLRSKRQLLALATP